MRSSASSSHDSATSIVAFVLPLGLASLMLSASRSSGICERTRFKHLPRSLIVKSSFNNPVRSRNRTSSQSDILSPAFWKSILKDLKSRHLSLPYIVI